MTGLKLLADKVDAKLMSRATAGHAASIGISGALSFACADLLADLGGWRLAFLAAAVSAAIAWLLVALAVPGHARAAAAPRTDGAPVRLPPGVPQPLGHGLCRRLLHPHARDERAARLGRGVPRLSWPSTTGAPASALSPDPDVDAARAARHGGQRARQRGRDPCSAGDGSIAMAMIGRRRARSCSAWSGRSRTVLAVAADPALRRRRLARFIVADGRRRRHRRSRPPRRDARGAFDARLCRRLRRPAGGRLDARFQGANAAAGWATAFTGIAALSALALIVFLVMRPRALAGDRA